MSSKRQSRRRLPAGDDLPPELRRTPRRALILPPSAAAAHLRQWPPASLLATGSCRECIAGAENTPRDGREGEVIEGMRGERRMRREKRGEVRGGRGERGEHEEWAGEVVRGWVGATDLLSRRTCRETLKSMARPPAIGVSSGPVPDSRSTRVPSAGPRGLAQGWQDSGGTRFWLSKQLIVIKPRPSSATCEKTMVAPTHPPEIPRRRPLSVRSPPRRMPSSPGPPSTATGRWPP